MKFLKSPYLVLAGLVCVMSMQPNFAESDSAGILSLSDADENVEVTLHPSRIIARFKTTEEIAAMESHQGFTDVDLFLATIGATREKTLLLESPVQTRSVDFLQLDDGVDVMSAINALQGSGLVVYAGPDHVYKTSIEKTAILPRTQELSTKFITGKMSSSENVPNDPLFPEQWALENTGQSDGTPGADISILDAWEITQGTGDTVIAVLGDGIFCHEDLECMGDRAETGFNRLSDSLSIARDSTAYAGLMGAKKDNVLGIVGVNPNATMVAYSFKEWEQDEERPDRLILTFSSSSFLSSFNAVVNAKRNGTSNIRIMFLDTSYNLNLIGYRDLLQTAGENGILMIRGFTGSNRSTRYVMQSLPTNRNDEVFGGFDSTANDVDIAAPGIDLFTTFIDQTGPFDFASGYRALNPGSFSSSNAAFASAAHVAGAASLIFDHIPELGPLGVESLIKQTGDPVAGLSEVVGTGRRLNVANALNCQPGNPVLELLEAPEDGFRVPTGAVTKVEYSAFDCGFPVAATIIVTPGNGDSIFQLEDDGNGVDRIAGDGIYSGQWVAVTPAENVNLSIQTFSPELTARTIQGEVVARPPAVNIELSGILSRDGGVCEAGTVYRIGTRSVFGGKPIDVLVSIGDNANFENFNNTTQRCLSVVNGRLRAWLGGSPENSFVDVNYKIVEAGTDLEIKANSLLLTGFDLDSNPGITSTDDILLDSPTTLLVSPASEVTGLNGDFIDGRYTHILKGTALTGCSDSGSSRDITCSGAALWNSKGLGISEVNFRLQNTSTSGTNQERQFDISFQVQDAIDLVNRPPVAIIEGFPTGGPAPLTGTFTAANSFDLGGEVVSYEWDFGDGTTADSMETSHTWEENGIYTMILKVTDNDGASAVEIILVNVTDAEDDVPPRIRLLGDNTIFLKIDDEYIEAGAVAIDDRDGPLEVTITGSVSTGAAGITTLTYTATDSMGNTSSIERIVIVDSVLDLNAPVISLNGAANVTLNLNDAYQEQGATANDDFDGAVDVIITGEVNTSVAGEYIISYSATDAAGNSSLVARTVTVLEGEPDTTAPAITLNGDATIILAFGETYNEAGATAIDDVDGDVTVVITGAVDTNTAGTYTVTYTATDAAGNTSSITRSVVVEAEVEPDTVAPVITLNGDAAITISVGDSYVEAGASALDAVDGMVEVAISGTVDTTNAGIYTLTYSAVDAAGNTATVTRVVTVMAIVIPDTTAPVITLNGSATLSINVGESFTDPGATALDDRDGEVDVAVDGSVDTATAGDYTLTYSATDMAGNTGTATRTVSVIEVPNLGPSASFSTSTTAGLAPLSVDFDAAASNDSDGEIVSYDWDFGDSSSDNGVTTSHIFTDAGDYVVTLTVTDNEGATATATTTISVNVEAEEVSYLKVVDTQGGYHHLKIGHNPDNLWKPRVSPAVGNDTLYIRLRADSDIDWNKIEVVPQSEDDRGIVTLGDYIDGNPEGWIDVNIPLSDYPAGAFDDITLISFFTRGIDPFSICIERIEFVGNNNFLWFGAPDKLDVAFDTPFSASVVTVDPSGPTHLQVIDTNGGWQHLKIGHNPDNLWKPKISPAGNNTALTFRVKAGDGVDWDKLQIIPQGKPEKGVANLGDYLPANTDGWFDIVIPLADYPAGAFDNISLISIFGNGTDPFEIGLESIIFTGGDEFIWFGAPGTTSLSLETDWFTQLIVSSEGAAARSRMAKSGLLDIQQATETTAVVEVSTPSAGGGGSLPLQGLLGLLLLLTWRRQR